MNTIEVNFSFSDQDKLTIQEAVREAIKQEIEAFGIAQRQNIIYKSTAETCKILSCSKPTLSRWKSKGYINAIQIGGRILFSEFEIKKAASLGLKYRH